MNTFNASATANQLRQDQLVERTISTHEAGGNLPLGQVAQANAIGQEPTPPRPRATALSRRGKKVRKSR